MPSITCNICHKSRNVPEEYIGKTVKCWTPNCTGTIRISDASSGEDVHNPPVRESVTQNTEPIHNTPVFPPPTPIPIKPVDQMKHCRTCGGQVLEKAVACMQCGVPPRNGKDYCYHCGNQTRPEAIVCTKCGISCGTMSNDTIAEVKNYAVSLFKGDSSMSLWDAFVICIDKYADFNGRARRREYWGFTLFVFIFAIISSIINAVAQQSMRPSSPWGAPNMGGDTQILMLLAVYGMVGQLALLLPSFAVTWRRFHDAGYSGITALPVYIVYCVSLFISMIGQQLGENFRALTGTGGIVAINVLLSLISLGYIIFVTTRDSVPGENKYGPNPKGA